MATARFTLITLLAFLLLKPLLTTVFREVEKPVIILAQDNSESLITSNDSSFYRNDYRTAFEEMRSALEENYEVVEYAFGDKVVDSLNWQFDHKQTDISNLIDELYTRYSNRNIGAVVMATDGIVNKGSSPLYLSTQLKAPIYTIALGDTVVKKDVLISKVAHNRLAYLGNEFPVEVSVRAFRCAGEKVQLKVMSGTATVFLQELSIDKEDYSAVIPLLLKTEKTGIQRYRVELSEVVGEVSVTNNGKDFFVDVLDSRQKILLLAAGVHPDVGALKAALGTNENYELTASLANDFTGNLQEYNLIILHQIPATGTNHGPLLKEIARFQLPTLFVLGGKSDINEFNGAQSTIRINRAAARVNEVLAVPAADFSLFRLTEKTVGLVPQLPPLQAPFGDYQPGTAAKVLLNQKIGLVETPYPLMAFQSLNGSKQGIIAGEGIWRWRLANYLQEGNHNAFNELVGKMAQYLSAKEDKSFFRVYSDNNFQENEPILFEAEVYNQSYELINEPKVTLEITDEEGKKFPFEMVPFSESYNLNAGILPVGQYSYRAQVKIGETIQTERGEFSISPIQVESVVTLANHQLLYQIASRSGGEMLYPTELATLPNKLGERSDVVPISYSHKELKDLINLKWVFFLLLTLLSLEWFLRKRNGAY